LTVATFEGDPANMKLTTSEDFVREEARLAAQLGDIRTAPATTCTPSATAII